MTRIVTTVQLPQETAALLTPVGGVVGPDGWQSQLSGAVGLLALVNVPIGEALLAAAPALRVVANAAVGYDNVDLAACGRRGVVVTNTPDVLTGATADVTIALLLSAVRGLSHAERSLREGAFRGWDFWDYLEGDVEGSALGILGMGRIGRAVARRARALGMVVQYHNRNPLPADVEEELTARWIPWEELLATSDVLSLHAPYGDATHHLLDSAALRRMKRGSYLVNTSRGALVDEAALVEALRSGWLAGAGLDVYESEPAIHPGLLELRNVTLLPHVGSATPRTRRAMLDLAARNILAVLKGGEPLTPVLP